MPKVYFTVENRIVDAQKGQTIRDVARNHGIHLNREFIYHLNCAGHGVCGTCRVWAKGRRDDDLSPMTLRERALGLRGTQRLACQAKVQGDVEVHSYPGGDDRLDPTREVDPPVLDWNHPADDSSSDNAGDPSET